EQFTWSNPNTRWTYFSDITLAVNWATLGAGTTASAFMRAASSFSGMADTLTTVADTRSALAALQEGDGLTALTEGDAIATGEAIPSGEAVPPGEAALPGDVAGGGVPLTLAEPALVPALRTLVGVNSKIATGFNWTKTSLEWAGYGLGTVQTGVAVD